MQHVYAQRRARVAAALGPDGIAIIPTAPERPRNRDSDFLYRHDSYFYYLTGFTEPEAVLAIVVPAGSAPARSVLFCRPKHEEREIWDGFRFGPEAAKEAFGLDEAHSVEEIDATLPKLLANAAAVAYPLAESGIFDRRMRRWLDAVRMQGRAGVSSPHQALDVRAILDELRLFKDPSELDIMRRAGRISAGAHVRAMQASRAGLREYHLERRTDGDLRQRYQRTLQFHRRLGLRYLGHRYIHPPVPFPGQRSGRSELRPGGFARLQHHRRRPARRETRTCPA